MLEGVKPQQGRNSVKCAANQDQPDDTAVMAVVHRGLDQVIAQNDDQGSGGGKGKAE